MLQIESVLESLEGFVDAPAFVIKVAEGAGGKARGVEQIGHQDGNLAVGRDKATQANLLGFARTFLVISVAPLGCVEHDDLFIKARAQERAHARETAVAGLFDPHTERNALVFEQAKQNLVGQRGALDLAGAQNETVLLGARDEPVVERGDGGQ